MNVIPETISMH